ncbi:hypothetical protein EW146_g7567 [Bondarzewia mesenterica]|uniref:Uncharacterized protein n=1 Tax=Bondarzewia mesenterica TaxID=1095465 RepID=A0A4S4LM85_9AGAM|nr:hypothetical protein EW146_g7567 [Bondarzewia mesenterica]
MPEQFWADFMTGASKQMTFTTITVQLHKLHKVEDEQVSAKARADYGSDFSSFFSYTKDGVSVEMTEHSAIMKHY